MTIRLLIEDVVLVKGAEIAIQARFKGGATESLTVPVPLSAWQMRKTSPEILEEMDRLLDDRTVEEIAQIFNERGLLTRVGNSYKPVRIQRIQERYRLKSRYDRLREAGYLTVSETARLLGVSVKTVQERRRRELLNSVRGNDNPEYLYERPDVCVRATQALAKPAR